MSTQRTPGPWLIGPDYTHENIYQLWDEFGNYPDNTSPAVMDANARLIAAAPELLEACKAAEANLSPEYASDHLVMRLLRVAIAKAEGRT